MLYKKIAYIIYKLYWPDFDAILGLYMVMWLRILVGYGSRIKSGKYNTDI